MFFWGKQKWWGIILVLCDMLHFHHKQQQLYLTKWIKVWAFQRCKKNACVRVSRCHLKQLYWWRWHIMRRFFIGIEKSWDDAGYCCQFSLAGEVMLGRWMDICKTTLLVLQNAKNGQLCQEILWYAIKMTPCYTVGGFRFLLHSCSFYPIQ